MACGHCIKGGRAVNTQDSNQTHAPESPALKRWKAAAVLWPLLCAVFIGVIVSQPGRTGEQRLADTGFVLISLIFFAIGMRLRGRMLKERCHATVLTSATVVSSGVRVHPGNNHYYPEYEFRVGEKTVRVKSKNGYGHCHLTVGGQVELYYAPEDPGLFYVPLMQKFDKRWSALLCGVGIVYPLVGLLAPWLRVLVASK